MDVVSLTPSFSKNENDFHSTFYITAIGYLVYKNIF